MKTTFNDCSYSELWVSPKNWKTTTAKSALKKNWYVQCYFHDPIYADRYPEGFPFRRKLNKFKTLELRRDAAEFYLQQIPLLFEQKGYNPITKSYMVPGPAEVQAEPEPRQVSKLEDAILTTDTPFIEALEYVHKTGDFADSTANDIRLVLEHFSTSAETLRYDAMPISTVKRMHIKNVINHLEITTKKFSNHKFNKYRTYLHILFAELVECEAIENNIISGIKKKKTITKIREVLSLDERRAIDKILSKEFPEFWLFVQIFFHSGGRLIELLGIKISDVDLEKQRYMALVKKGKQHVWVWRVIKTIALPFWRTATSGGQPDDYIFSVGLIPGEKKIRREQITRRWKVHVKDKLGIKADIYSLKHSNLDETVEALSLKDAAAMANHTSTAMVASVYAVGEKARQFERLKNVNNSFA